MNRNINSNINISEQDIPTLSSVILSKLQNIEQILNQRFPSMPSMDSSFSFGKIYIYK